MRDKPELSCWISLQLTVSFCELLDQAAVYCKFLRALDFCVGALYATPSIILALTWGKAVKDITTMKETNIAGKASNTNV